MAEVKYPKPTELDPNTYQEPIEDIVKRAKEEREKKKPVIATPPKKMAKGGSTRARPELQKINKPTTRQGKMELFSSGGKTKSASSRADGCAIRGKTKA